MLKRLAWLFALLFVFSTLSYGQERLQISSTKSRVIFAAGREQTILTGNVQIRSSKVLIQSQELIIYGAGYRFVESKLPVIIKDLERNILLQGDNLYYDRELEILRIRGNAIMEDYENEIVLKGGILEHRQKEEITIVQLGVRVFKKDITTRSELLIYKRDLNIAELSGIPVVYKKKDIYRADTITINLDTDEVSMTGKVSGTVETEE